MSRQVTTHLPDHVAEWLDRLAAGEGRTRSSMLRRILTTAYKRYREDES